MYAFVTLIYFAGYFKTPYESNLFLATEILCSIFAVIKIKREQNWIKSNSKNLFLLILITFGLADLLYGLQRLTKVLEFAPSILSISELTYSISATFMFLFVATGFSKRKNKLYQDLLPLILASSFAVLMSYIFVLKPYFSREKEIQIFYSINSIYFNVLISIVSAMSVYLSLRVTNLSEFFATNGIALFGITSVAIGYSDSTGETPKYTVNHEAMWALSYILLLASTYFSDGNKGIFWTNGRSRPNSLRVSVALKIILTNILVVSVLNGFGAIDLKNAFSYSTVFYGFFGIWITSNLIALNSSKQFSLVLNSISENNNVLKSENDAAIKKVSISPKFYEFDSIISAYNETLEFADKKIEESKIANNEKVQVKAISELALQVSHDIRSPLAALEMISGSLNELPEDKRLIIRNSINRIRDIANSLLDKNRTLNERIKENTLSDVNTKDSGHTEGFSAILLCPLIDSIITEKRIQYRNHIGIRIEFNQSKESYGLFAYIQPNEFQRVLSNLINNSVESFLRYEGTVDVILKSNESDQIEIIIKDNGKGIPESLLAKLGSRGETHRKDGGSGLGLFHAKNTMGLFRGNLKIESRLNFGTTLTLTLPRDVEQKWFVPKINLKHDQTLVVFDDDQAIHQIWTGRIESLPHHQSLSVYHFSNPTEFRKFYGKSFDKLDGALFLMDYEIIGTSETGLDLIESLGIQKQAILVTSRYEEKHIRERCNQLGIRMIPKSMSGFVPMEIIDS